jgi:hypothetical protein
MLGRANNEGRVKMRGKHSLTLATVKCEGGRVQRWGRLAQA